jgi:hypothetical protein
MTEPLRVRIQECRTPQAAIMLLAEEIDTLRSQLGQREDPWTMPREWGDGGGLQRGGSDPPPAADSATAQQRKIEKLQAKLAEAIDPDEVRSLEAQLRLAKEEHVRLDSPVVPALESEDGIIEIPPPTPERIAKRMQWAAEVGLEAYMMNGEAIKTAGAEAKLYANFGKVGPKGLYVTDRLAIMQLPVEARRWLIEDMAIDDVAYAQNMGADILKSEDSMTQDMARELHEPTWKS